MRFSSRYLVPLSILCASCDSGGQSGGEVKQEPGDPTEGNSGSCDEDTTELGGPEEESPLGFTAADVLAFAEGPHTTTTEWLMTGSLVPLTSNVSGSTELTVEVSYQQGEIRYVDSSPAAVTEGLLIGIDATSTCPDRVEIDVQVRISTGDGALDETFDATIRALQPWVAELSVPLNLAELEGSLELSTEGAANTSIEQVELRTQLADGLFRGELRGLVVQTNSQVASAGGFELLRWGPEVCAEGEIPLPADTGTPRATSMVDVVNDHGSFTLTWDDGQVSALSLAVSSDEPWACLRWPEASVVLEAELTATSDDGRIDSKLDVELIGRMDTPGAYDQVHLLFNAYFAKAVPISDFEARFGITGAELSTYETATISFGTVYDLSTDSVTTDGALQILGLTQADCTAQPEPPSGGNASAPGCAGTESTVVDSATW